jgi:hypothetical protein
VRVLDVQARAYRRKGQENFLGCGSVPRVKFEQSKLRQKLVICRGAAIATGRRGDADHSNFCNKGLSSGGRQLTYVGIIGLVVEKIFDGWHSLLRAANVSNDGASEQNGAHKEPCLICPSHAWLLARRILSITEVAGSLVAKRGVEIALLKNTRVGKRDLRSERMHGGALGGMQARTAELKMIASPRLGANVAANCDDTNNNCIRCEFTRRWNSQIDQNALCLQIENLKQK